MYTAAVPYRSSFLCPKTFSLFLMPTFYLRIKKVSLHRQPVVYIISTLLLPASSDGVV